MGKRFVSVMATLLLGFIPSQAQSQSPCKIMVIGFVGGMRSPEDVKQGVVQIGNRLRSINRPDLQVQIYRHWFWRRAYDSLYQTIDRNGDDHLSREELEQATRIVIYGHSLGGWAVNKLSRRLVKVRVPVELTVQIDSIGIRDGVVPGNVKFAANFYQRNAWLLRGRKTIKGEEGSQTKVLGNFLLNSEGHEALAREAEISDFIVERVRALCANPIAINFQ